MMKFIKYLLAKAHFIDHLQYQVNQLGQQLERAKIECQTELLNSRRSNAELTDMRKKYKDAIYLITELKEQLNANQTAKC